MIDGGLWGVGGLLRGLLAAVVGYDVGVGGGMFVKCGVAGVRGVEG